MLECIQKTLEGHITDTVDFQYAVPGTGRSGWASHTEAPLHNAKGEIIGVIATVRDITAHKKAEEQLRSSEAQLKEAQRVGQIGSWDWDAVNDTIIWSDEYYRICGFDPKLPTPNYLDHLKAYTPESGERLDAAVKMAMQTGESYELDLEFADPGKQTRWICARGEVKRDASGSIVGLRGTAQNLTERKKMEQEKTYNEKRFRNLVESTSDWVWEVDENARYTYASPKIRDLLGYEPEEILGKTPFDFMPDEEVDRVAAIFGPIAAAQQPIVGLENINLHKDGRQVILETSGVPVFDSNRNFHGYRGVDRDVTKRKRAEEALKKSEAFNRSILETVDEGFIVIDRAYRIVSANRAFTEKCGMAIEDMIGRHCFEISHHCIAPCWEDGKMCAVRQVFDTGETRSVMHTHYDAQGAPVYVETKAYPLTKDESGKVMTVIEIVVDITEHKKLEAQLRHAQKMEAVGTLAGGVAHDFNNILNVIIGYGIMVLDRLGDDPLSKEQINEVLAAADRAANLTKRLLAFSRKQVVEMKPVNVNEIILGMEKMLSRIIGEDIAFTMELTGRKMIVMADAGQMEQVLMNLISNARDAMPKGGRLTIGTEMMEMDDAYITAYGYGKAGTYALISVTDTGSGMDAETQKKIFEPFFTTKGIGEGTGLGLAIAYGIIKQHDGYIKVYSEEGKGTTFKIYLPLIEEAATKGRKVEAAASGQRRDRDHTHRRRRCFAQEAVKDRP